MAVLLALKTAGATLGLNYAVHLGSSVAYAKLCLPQSVWDLARSIITTGSPMCSLLISTVQITHTNYAGILTTTIAGVISGLLK